MALPFFTVGHSNRSLGEFIRLLHGAEVQRVVDIRKMPMSRANPQFNASTLTEALVDSGIAFEHVPALGGLRGKTRSVAAEVNAFWTNDSFHNYADYALSAQFHAGLEHLRAAGRDQRCVIMCSEAVWWRCHRRIVADYLIAAGETVFHLMGEGRVEPARLTSAAVMRAEGTIVYPSIQTSGE